MIVPVYNEADNLEALVARLVPVLEHVAASHEILFVDDGSSDKSMEKLRALHALDHRCRAVSFSRNFGKEIAIAAGLDAARGDAVVIMDADLQHPPEMIEKFMEQWREGYDVVYGQRIDRHTDSWARRAFTAVFYHLFASFGETPLPDGAGDFPFQLLVEAPLVEQPGKIIGLSQSLKLLQLLSERKKQLEEQRRDIDAVLAEIVTLEGHCRQVIDTVTGKEATS